MIDLSGTIAAVVAGLKAAGVSTVSADPADVIAPGVLVSFLELRRVSLSGRDVVLELALVVSDTDALTAAANLSALLALVETYASPDGPIQARSVVLASNPTPLPGLLFPLIIRKEDV